jgi:hypothetical protein
MADRKCRTPLSRASAKPQNERGKDALAPAERWGTIITSSSTRAGFHNDGRFANLFFNYGIDDFSR